MPEIILENGVSLSKSVIWDFQKQYFEDKGIHAWVGEVPFYITSNVVFAHSYARVLAVFLCEGWASGRLSLEEPVYMVELGTGTGKFSFYCVSYLKKLVSKFKTKGTFCYVMTDFTHRNLEAWKENASFDVLRDEGLLDFSIYDTSSSTSIYLEYKKKYLNGLVNPLCVVANYVFDSIPHDFFSISQGALLEQKTVTSIQSDLFKDGKIEALKELSIEFIEEMCVLPRYEEAVLNEILEGYLQKYPEGNFLLPVGAFYSIRFLESLSRQGIFMLSSDKGYTVEETIKTSPGASLSFHGSFSLMVNYAAIASYMSLRGGDFYLDTQSNGLRIGMFASSFNWKEFPHTAMAFEDHIIRFSTSDFLSVKNKLIEQKETLELTDLIAVLKLGQWDIDLFLLLASELMTKLDTFSIQHKSVLQEGLLIMQGQIFTMPHAQDPYFDLGRLAYQLGDLEASISLYSQSVAYNGAADCPHLYNLVLSYYYLNLKTQALDYFQQCKTLDANFLDVSDWGMRVFEEL